MCVEVSAEVLRKTRRSRRSGGVRPPSRALPGRRKNSVGAMEMARAWRKQKDGRQVASKGGGAGQCGRKEGVETHFRKLCAVKSQGFKADRGTHAATGRFCGQGK